MNKYLQYIKKFGIINFFKSANSLMKKKKFVIIEKFINKNKISYSQYCEDIFIDRLLNYKGEGFYVDVGANHPCFLNNTKIFSDRGWTGINIEPNIVNYKIFNEVRPKDINLNIGISSKDGFFDFYNFKEDTLSTFSPEIAENLLNNGRQLVSKENVKLRRLSSIFNEYKIKDVDFITIDTEGNDEDVIMSNDWDKYRPKIVCVEDNFNSRNLQKLFKKYNYKKIKNNGLNSFFVDRKRS